MVLFRQPGRVLVLVLFTGVAGCGALDNGKRPTLEGEMAVIDQTGLNDIMLTMANPEEAVAHFRNALAREPDNPEFMRGLATSLVRAKQPQQAAPVFERLIGTGKATTEDRLLYAESLVGAGAIPDAEKQLDQIPPTVETYKRYLLEAIVADHNKEWKKSDSFYETARGLTTKPAAVMNNWGMSKLARGDFDTAANYFQQAITFNPEMFQAKNNLVTARGRKRNYQMPVIPMNEEEEAVLLYNLGIIAVRQGDTDVARGLFELAVETHPQHYPEAADNLAALQNAVGR